MDNISDTQRVKQLIYGGEILTEDDYESMLDKIDDFPQGTEHGCRRVSLYVRLFEDMINTVYKHESHLLSQSEWEVFATLSSYCYNARYCLVRLVLRKPDQWHALSSLASYKKEVGEVGLIRAITDLCRPCAETMNETYDIKQEMEMDVAGVKKEEQENIRLTFVEKKEEQEIVHLTFVEEEEEQGIVRLTVTEEKKDVKVPALNIEAGPLESQTSRKSATLSDSDFPAYHGMCQSDFQEVQLDSFCYDESSMDATELLGRLSVKQLKDLVKMTKSKPAKFNKSEMISALLANAATQSVLDFSPGPSNSALRRISSPCFRQALPPGAKTPSKGKEKAVQKNQEQWLVQMVLKILGKCVKVNTDFYRLVRRLHLICFRCTEQPTALLLPALLTSFKKRAYPQYKYKRDKSIWPTREDLLTYEEALDLEAELEEVSSKAFEKQRDLITPGPSSVALGTSIGKILRTPRTPLTTPRHLPTFGSGLKEGLEDQMEDASMLPEVADEEEEEASIRKAKRVKQFMYDKIYPRWKEVIDAKTSEGCTARNPGLERFEPGHIYTRMLHHASRSLLTLKEHQAEYDLIQELLSQRFYRRGSRAKWYERRAILQMTYLSKAGGFKDQNILKRAREGVREALVDEDTGIVWRPGLFRRLQRLEKMLNIPEEECTPLEVELREPQRVFIKAARATKRENSIPNDVGGRTANPKSGIEPTGLHAYFIPKKNSTELIELEEGMPNLEGKENATRLAKQPSWKGKSLWVGRDNEVVHVEIRALQYYETLGFKGFHSESRILTSIFSLLFWDIIFADVPGAFETPYQTAPLDLTEDTFSYARGFMIETRLKEIRDGNAKTILEKNDDQHREKQTMCIGLRWDICEKADLIEIIECLGGHTLSLICQLFCEDYGGRSSGVPDLVVWDANQGICKFVEVKGPGDRPQENQKLWFDSLLRAGANVEICHVIDMNAPKEKRKTPGTGRKRKALKQELSDEHENGEDHRQLDNDAPWIPPDVRPLSEVDASVPRKRRRRKTLDDELPSCSLNQQMDDLLTPSRLPRLEASFLHQTTLLVMDTPSKRRKG